MFLAFSAVSTLSSCCGIRGSETVHTRTVDGEDKTFVAYQPPESTVNAYSEIDPDTGMIIMIFEQE